MNGAMHTSVGHSVEGEGDGEEGRWSLGRAGNGKRVLERGRTRGLYKKNMEWQSCKTAKLQSGRYLLELQIAEFQGLQIVESSGATNVRALQKLQK